MNSVQKFLYIAVSTGWDRIAMLILAVIAFFIAKMVGAV